MANAYATFAADGVFCEATPILSITDSRGQPVAAGNTKCSQAISTEVARAAADVARCVTGYQAATGSCGSWSTAQGLAAEVGRPFAGKTGTTDDSRSGWFVGFTPELAAASFIADPDNPNHRAGSGNTHKTDAVVAGLLRRGLEGVPIRDFIPPSRLTAMRGTR
jgi:membrane peptidoglycan carboxypeptidase